MKLIPICEHADSLLILAMARKMNIKFNQIRKKKIITQAKYEEQQGRCGYCEANLLDKDGNLSSKCVHLDHFHQQCLCDELKFSWNNLILSCNSPNSCGYYKDTPRQKISSSDIFPSTDFFRISVACERDSITSSYSKMSAIYII